MTNIKPKYLSALSANMRDISTIEEICKHLGINLTQKEDISNYKLPIWMLSTSQNEYKLILSSTLITLTTTDVEILDPNLSTRFTDNINKIKYSFRTKAASMSCAMVFLAINAIILPIAIVCANLTETKPKYRYSDHEVDCNKEPNKCDIYKPFSTSFLVPLLLLCVLGVNLATCMLSYCCGNIKSKFCHAHSTIKYLLKTEYFQETNKELILDTIIFAEEVKNLNIYQIITDSVDDPEYREMVQNKINELQGRSVAL